MPSTARPSETWSSVVASLAVMARVAERVGADHQPEPDPRRQRAERGEHVQPSKIGCSHGPKMAIR